MSLISTWRASERVGKRRSHGRVNHLLSTLRRVAAAVETDNTRSCHQFCHRRAHRVRDGRDLQLSERGRDGGREGEPSGSGICNSAAAAAEDRFPSPTLPPPPLPPLCHRCRCRCCAASGRCHHEANARWKQTNGRGTDSDEGRGRRRRKVEEEQRSVKITKEKKTANVFFPFLCS